MSVKKLPIRTGDVSYGKEHVLVRCGGKSPSQRELGQISKHSDQSVLTLNGVQTPNLDFLADWRGLACLTLYDCSVEDFGALLDLETLKELSLNSVNPMKPDLGFLSRLSTIEVLRIGNMPELERLPNLSKCAMLRKLFIFGCQRLTDINSVAKIPNIEAFSIIETPQRPSDLAKVMKLKSIRSVEAVFSDEDQNAEFRGLLEKHRLA